MARKINYETIQRVLEMSKYDINIWDVLSDFDSEQDEEIIEFIDDNVDEFEIFLNTTLVHVMNRLKIRIAFATKEEEKE